MSATNSSQLATRNDVHRFIVKEVNEFWRAYNKLLHLTALGSRINKHLPEGMLLERLLPERLRRFVEDLRDEVRVYKHPRKDGTYGVAPASAQVPTDSIDELEKSFGYPSALRGSKTAASKLGERRVAPGERVYSNVWSCFKEPIESGRQRIMLRESPFYFRDIPDSESVPADYFVIDREFVIQKSGTLGPGDARAIHSSIAQFCHKHELDVSLFVEPSPEPTAPIDTGAILEVSTKSAVPSSVHYESVAPTQKNTPSSFHKLMEALHELEERDRQRVTIPADILCRLYFS